MRLVSLFIATTAFLSVGCGHSPKKVDANSTPTPPAKTGHPTASETAKNEPAKQTATASSTKVECSVKGDDRILEIREKGAGCELIYTKFGKEGSVANANRGQEYCQKTLDKMREKLTGSGYTCK